MSWVFIIFLDDVGKLEKICEFDWMGSAKFSGWNSFCQETVALVWEKKEKALDFNCFPITGTWRRKTENCSFSFGYCAIITCPYSRSFYSVALSLFPSPYLICLSLTLYLQWPTWRGIKTLCHCHACRLIFIYTKPLHFGSWLCSDTISHHWQIWVRRHDIVWGRKCWSGLPAPWQCGA